MFIEISLLRPNRGDNFLTYSVPEIFFDVVQKGDIVEIPIRNSRELGVVFSVFSEAPEFETKMMGKILQKQFFSEKFLDFIQEISEYFFCSPSFFLSKSAPIEFFQYTPASPQQKFYRAKNIPEISEIKNKITGKKQQELCEYFVGNANLRSLQNMKSKFSSAVIKTALEKNYISEFFQEKFPENFDSRATNSVEKKQNIFYPLSELDLHPQKNIIVGSNHSAKNAVLAQLIQEKIQKNEQVLFIFPDQISLEQAYTKFQKIFESEHEYFVDIYSSGTSKKNKEELFFKLQSGYTKILLASKNALFFQYKNLGLIMVHEYHNDLYVTQNFPFTHAKDIAKIRAKTENIDLVFSATTGDIEEVFSLESKNDTSEISGKFIEFSSPVETQSTQIIDMNLERMNKNLSSISYTLEVALRENLENGQQSLLFLNRKGLFTSLFCSECKWSPTSPLSGNKLGVFKDKSGKKVLRCTTSKYHEKFPEVCPQCHKNTLIEMGKGTQEVEEILRKKFPTARIFRADKDTLSSPAKSRNFLEEMNAGEIDIVVGTQIIAQAFPFKNVSLVANIMTENDILFPSFKAEEKGFLKNQKFLDIVGSKFPAKKMLQTFCPHHPFLQTLQENNFQKFYQSEISARKSLHYPPFSTGIEISKNAKTEKTLEKNFQEIQSEISSFCEKVFPIHISYHPQRQIFTAKMLLFTQKIPELWEYLQKKGVTLNRYSE